MIKRRIGLLTFSDGRENAHREVEPVARRFQERLATVLNESGEIEIVAGEQIVWTPAIAQQEAKRLHAMDCEMTIFNFAVWSFPHLAVIASRFAPGPFLLFSNINPSYPGMVGMLASAGALDQVGTFHGRLSGDIEEEDVRRRLMAFVRGATAVKRLVGETYGQFGGRPMGMYTAVANSDQWMEIFGIDVEHIDQSEIIRLAGEAPQDEVDKAFAWITEHVGEIRYDGDRLTPETLKRQIRSYIAARSIIKDKDLSFVGFKAQPELTDHFTTMDLTEAFLNDPYDWNGPKEPTVAATESDMDGALTMEILKHISGQPTLFADVRHYDAEIDCFDLCNSGTHATYFAAGSMDPTENLPRVSLYPQTFYFPAGGAAVRHIAAPGKVTLARLARRSGQYWLAILPAEFVKLTSEDAERRAATSQIEWPHAFARLEVDADTFLAEYDSNHIHGVYGNYVDELIWAAKCIGIPYQVFSNR